MFGILGAVLEEQTYYKESEKVDIHSVAPPRNKFQPDREFWVVFDKVDKLFTNF